MQLHVAERRTVKKGNSGLALLFHVGVAPTQEAAHHALGVVVQLLAQITTEFTETKPPLLRLHLRLRRSHFGELPLQQGIIGLQTLQDVE